jgi:hypothetical protein
MKNLIWNASDAIVLAARLYVELASSALTLLPSRRERADAPVEGFALASEPVS